MTTPCLGPRRFVLSFAVALVCALAVFTLPRFVSSSVSQLVAQQPSPRDTAAHAAPAAVTVSAPTVVPPQATPGHAPFGARLIALIGMAGIIAVGWLVSRDRKAVDWRVIGTGLVLQVLFGIFVLRVPFGQSLFRKLGEIVTAVLSFSYKGSEFVFGPIGAQHSSIGIVFAFQILPAII